MSIQKNSIKSPAPTQAKYPRQRSVRSGGKEKLSDYIKPMLAQIYDEPFDSEEWIYEIKWDGYRAVAEVADGEVRLYSRNGLSFLGLYPAVAEALQKMKDAVVFDGEIVVLNKKGKPDFQKLQQYDHNPSLTILYYVFDCLAYNGKSIMNLPLTERKRIAQKIIGNNKIIKYSDHVEGAGIEFFTKVSEMDLEGIIAKRAASLYIPGKRTSDWLKIKNHSTQEAVIAGYTAPKGSREYFGALILGIYDNTKLRYIGHTGTGFTSAILKEVYETIHPMRRSSSPFENKIPVNSPVTWVEPKVVCNIKFTEVTEEGILRHPVFMGMRIDKSAKEANKLDVTVQSAAKRKRY